ncbi:MAG: valine--tRNA ligase [bacterium]
MSISTRYDPFSIEEKWYKYWEERNLFLPSGEGKKFSITIPPPNITGSLHMGHALNYTLQDIVVRYKRMRGYSALCLPGTDHAGIATQYVVERELAKEKKTRFDVGKEAFLQMIWAWKEKYGDTIIKQFKRMGYSFDWSRLRFTLDEAYSKAVRTAFVRLYEKGLIYKGLRMVNWCPRCQTSLSDLEVENREEETKLYYIKYPSDNGAFFITVATTRPETLLGDVAVAVHPDDDRYKEWVGKMFVLPFTGREIPLIADPIVDPNFGTGAVKITPAHDMDDYEVALRHNFDPKEILKKFVIMDKKGKIVKVKGYEGLDRFVAREKIVKELEKVALLEKVEPYTTVIGHCYRCGTVIEPYLSEQWFLKMDELVKPAIKVLEEERIRIIPERFKNILLNWLYNIKDWCISRQIWWGHPIPLYKCVSCNSYFASEEKMTKCPKCGKRVKQEEDVLDTWFSSALWPFATLGWPEETRDLRKYYPTDVLFTARDILFLWVGRMIIMGMEFMGDVPFEKVYVHPTVLTEKGKRMSKSLGTGIDPLELVDKYGADAVRFGLSVQASTGQDLRFSTNRIDMARAFCNKIWNATRFVLLNIAKEVKPIEEVKIEDTFDRWILTRLRRAIRETTKGLESYNFDAAALAIYNFFWDDFCDWYIEISKQRIQEETVQSILKEVLDVSLRLLHPFMPFVTEELWQKLPHQGESISIAPWPEEGKYPLDEEIEKRVEFFQEIVKETRNMRKVLGFVPRTKPKLLLYYNEADVPHLGEGEREIMKFLCTLSDVRILREPPSKGRYMRSRVGNVDLFLEMKQAGTMEEEIERTRKELREIEEQLERVESKLMDEVFRARAPQAVLEKQEAIKEELLEKKKLLLERLSLLTGTEEQSGRE